MLVYQPLDRGATEKHCLPGPSNSSIAGYKENGVNYFVHAYPYKRLFAAYALWENIRDKEADIVNAVL